MRLALGALLLLAACGPAKTEEGAAGPADGVPFVPPPPAFAAASDNARAVTGAVSLSAEPREADEAPRMKLVGVNGLAYFTELLPEAAAFGEAIDWTVLFRQEVVATANPPPGAPSVQVHTIVREEVPLTASNGGFCGEDPTNYIALATGLEQQGEKLMSVAAFKGGVWPPQTPDALCGVYTYTPPESPL